MITVINYLAKENEYGMLLKIQKNLAALLSDEEWRFLVCHSPEELERQIEDSPSLDIISYEIYELEAIHNLEVIRKMFPDLQILIIARKSISPMEYLRPSIRANSLLVSPWTTEQADKVFRELISFTVNKKNNLDSSERIYVKNKGETLRILYNDIYYFEAREKKIFLCTKCKEYSFRDTIDILEKALPKQFVRCHRSYIVNVSKIVRIDYAQNSIYLADDFCIPLSRSSKNTFKRLYCI